MSVVFKGADGWSAPINFVKMYSDGTPMVKTDRWEEIVEKAHTMVLRPDDMSEFITAMFLIDAIHSQLGGVRRLVLPYVPGARQDRVNPTGDVLFTLRSVMKMINNRVSKVVILDPHSPKMYDLCYIIKEYPLSKVAEAIPNNYTGIISADKGGKDRAEQFAKAMGLPVYYGDKTRDVSTGRLTGFSLEDLESNKENHHYLVVDDICDGGGTFNGLAEKIHEQGCTADLYVSHGIFSKGTDELKKNFEKIYTTDSRHINDRNDVTIIPVVEEMEKYND